MSSGSGTTNATESARWVTRVRAARFGLNPSRSTAASTAASASALTRLPPLIALEAVDRDTPAAAATSSRVGDARRPATDGCAEDPVVAVAPFSAELALSSPRAASAAAFRVSVICPLSHQPAERRPPRARLAPVAAT